MNKYKAQNNLRETKEHQDTIEEIQASSRLKKSFTQNQSKSGLLTDNGKSASKNQIKQRGATIETNTNYNQIAHLEEIDNIKSPTAERPTKTAPSSEMQKI